MKKFRFLVIYIQIIFFNFLFFGLSSCDKCSDTECFTPPESFYFQLIDKQTNQNLLQNGIYTLADIHIQSTTENKIHTLKVDSVEVEGQKQVVVIDNEIGWENGNNYKNYILTLNDSLFYTFVYYTEKKNENCCTFSSIEEISSSQIEISKTNSSSGFLYKLAL